jgi:hypothetical protein
LLPIGITSPPSSEEDDSPALDSTDVVDLVGQIAYGLLVQRGLLTAQGAERFHLGLVGQVRNDALVGFQASQDIGTHQLAERSVRVLQPVGEALDERRKLL